jgi:hypothetical protein
MLKKIRKTKRVKKARVKFLQFVCKNFGRYNAFGRKNRFRFGDIVKAGWTGPRWNLKQLHEDGYLRRSYPGKEYYSYARGASNGAKYGQVATRSKRTRDHVAITPENVFAKYKHEGLPELAAVKAKLEEVREQIKKLQGDETKLVEFLEALEKLPDIKGIISK